LLDRLRRGVTAEAVDAMTEIAGIIGKMNHVSAAIPAAVEEQSATTRSIAASIQGVASATAETAQAMAEVVEVDWRRVGRNRGTADDAPPIRPTT
jgi:methyl-accepting chemotaxis protein